ncbi:cytochrome PufQ [Salipiger mucosus]|uniref:Protein pufQ n=1 Tax=Salipiger mucosus DSM 16094 TaxID=1123237 RepID=S9Q3V8_9RHOB|nr:cytochrome PufQ [Salipiger mucosus]EPX76006.1 Protein pufQ [Salipiger mucosus DSM 16094]
MTDMASNPPPRRRHGRRRGAEFALYFTLIFLLALPAACFGWARDVIRRRTLNMLGPLARAWAEADRMTPVIFSV